MKLLLNKKIALAMLCACFGFITTGNLQAYAESASTDGTADHVSVELSTDKEQYNSDEEINLSIDIVNPHSYAINNLTVQVDLPENLALKSLEIPGNKTTLLSGERISAHAVVIAKESELSADIEPHETNEPIINNPDKSTPGSPSVATDVNSGDDGILGYAIVFLASLSIVFILLSKKKRANRLFGIVLCAAILINCLPISAVRVKAEEIPEIINDSIKSQTTILIDGKYYDISATISFSFSFKDVVDEYELDSDSDGIPDITENQWGLNPNNADTDGDKLSDYFEYNSYVTNPQMADTDENGISDFDEDSDNDGLKNGDEQTVGTFAFNKDSDSDGLTDGDEVYMYSTDPMESDTDEDGLTDYEEIKLGLDPLTASSDGVIKDSERVLAQTASDEIKDNSLQESENWLIPQISGEVTGLLDNQVTMRMDDSLAFNDNHSILSDVIEIDMSCTNALNLQFSFKENYTGNPEQLVIAYYDNDSCQLRLVDSQLSEEQNSLEGEITSSGYYFVMDIDEFLKSIGIDVMNNIIDSSEEIFTESDNTQLMYTPRAMTASADTSIGKADIVFVVDTTGSMSDAINNVQENINTFAEKMSNEYHVDMNYSLIEYRDIEEDGIDSTIMHYNMSSQWFTNVNAFKSEVYSLTADGGGDDPETPIDALERARRSNWRNGATRFVVLITDVYSKETNTSGIEDMNEMAQKFASDGIVVSVITNERSDYVALLDQTNGLYGYIYSDFSEILLQLADIIGTETHEGGDWIILDDYNIVQLKGSVNDIAILDSDEDGLKDSEELIEKITVDATFLVKVALLLHGVPLERYIGKTKIEMWSFKSNPTLQDTDHDAILDRYDLKPRKRNYYPDVFVNYINNNIISMQAMEKTNDGFYICTDSIADMLTNYGIETVSDGEDYEKVQSFFDDWYLFAVEEESTSYSLCKMREQENDGATGDNDDPGVTIPFISFNVNKLTDVLLNQIDNNDLWNEIHTVILTGDTYDKVLQKYFANVNSDASYLIGELYAKKMAGFSINNRLSLPNKYNEILDEILSLDEQIREYSKLPFMLDYLSSLVTKREKLLRVPNALNQINNNAKSTIYYGDDRYLQLVDAFNINKNEQLAILSAFTADINLNMFAAEVKFHAVALTDWKQYIPIAGKDWYNAAIRADMAIGEEKESGYYDEYYDPNSNLVKEQINAHGEQ